MYLHLVLPDRAQVDGLLQTRRPGSVSIYLATDPASDSRAERIELSNLWGDARGQLEAAGFDRATIEAEADLIDELLDDDSFWAYQANSLAVFLDEDGVSTFQLPNALNSSVHVSDRFHVKPLLRSLTFPPAAYVLALSANATRVLEVLPAGEPQVVSVPDMPADAVDAVGVPSISGRRAHGRVQGSEGQKMRLGQFSRAVDNALRPLLVGRDIPLILAAARPTDDIYKQWNTYPHLVETTIEGNAETLTDGELASRAREVLDQVHAQQLDGIRQDFETRANEGRGKTDVADVARAATFGMVDTLIVDMDANVVGSIDDGGAVTFDESDDAINYGVLDEITRRVWLTGGKVFALRRDDVPRGGDVAAILRWSPGA